MKKRFLTVALAMLVIISLVVVSALAAEPDACTDDCAHVAAIGTAHYDDLHEAMCAAKSGETVKLLKSVDLAGTEWTPVSFKGAFDGQNNTIYNLTIDQPGVSATGFITSLNGTFKNVTFTNPSITGGECTGVVAGRAGGGAALAKNITVDGTIRVETTHAGYARAGVIVGGWAYGNYEDITVDGTDAETSYIKHTGGGDGRYVAGIVGHADDVESYKNCTVKNISIISNGGWLCGGIAGPGPADGLAEGCHVENIKIGADYSGGMFGWYYGTGAIEDSSVKEVTFTAGSTGNGAIGGYQVPDSVTVKNVVIEDVTNSGDAPLLSYAAMLDDGANITYCTTLFDALKAVTEDTTVTLLDDITVSDAWDCRYNGARISVPVTIDGDGHTLTLTGEVDDKNWNTIFRFETDATLKNLTIDASEAGSIQRGISAKLGITMEDCTLIGNGTTAKRAVIFGEGAGSAIGNVEAKIDNCDFVGWSYGVSDNQNAQDAKSVSIKNSTFTGASVLVSASDAVVFTENEMTDAWVNICSYTNSQTLDIDAVGNTLEANTDTKENKISAALEAKIEADPDFNIVLKSAEGTKYYEVSFDIPKGANLKVLDAAGNLCQRVGDVYALADGAYTYVVSMRGCFTTFGVFTVQGETQTLSVSLEKKRVYGPAVTEAAWKNPFIDVSERAWYFDAVRFVNENGMMAGTDTENTRFSPNMTLSRAMLVTILWRLEDTPNTDGTLSFADVPADAWYADAVSWASAAGIIYGYDAQTFAPADALTCEQVMAILHRYADFAGLSYNDAEQASAHLACSAWAREHVLWAQTQGLVDAARAEAMTAPLQRAQIAACLHHFCEIIAD